LPWRRQRPDAGDAGDAGESGSTCDAGAACNCLTNSGVVVTLSTSALPQPAPLGGTILDGTYVLTAFTLYTGGDGGADAASFATADGGPATWEELAVISGSATSAQYVLSLDGSADSHENETLTFVDGGASFTSTLTCSESDGGSPAGPADYTASGSLFLVYIGSGVELTFTKQ